MSIEDKELGLINLLPNKRASRIIVRYKANAFYLTHPVYSSTKEILQVIDEMRPRLIALKEKIAPAFVFTESTSFSTLTFQVVIQKSDLDKIYTTLKDEVLYITFPHHQTLESKDTQLFIKETIESACRSEAKGLLPQLVKDLASKHDFLVNEVKVNSSRSRWGSCSSKKNINLSLYCLMLPKHLVEFVILHELCHTKEMNHGERFWALLDSVTGGRSRTLTKELKAVKLKW